eukprot:SM000156S02158  [mRNA]  locus=s156:258830:260875:+ [translate_table: standard]
MRGSNEVLVELRNGLMSTMMGFHTTAPAVHCRPTINCESPSLKKLRDRHPRADRVALCCAILAITPSKRVRVFALGLDRELRSTEATG